MALLILAWCCLTASFPVLSKPLRGADSEGSCLISAQESCTDCLRLSFFVEGIVWSRKGLYLCTPLEIVPSG